MPFIRFLQFPYIVRFVSNALLNNASMLGFLLHGRFPVLFPSFAMESSEFGCEKKEIYVCLGNINMSCFHSGK